MPSGVGWGPPDNASFPVETPQESEALKVGVLVILIATFSLVAGRTAIGPVTS